MNTGHLQSERAIQAAQTITPGAHRHRSVLMKDPWGRTMHRTEIYMGGTRWMRLDTRKEIPGVGNGALCSDAYELDVLGDGSTLMASNSYHRTLIRTNQRATPKAIGEQHIAAILKLEDVRPELFTTSSVRPC